MLYNNTKSISSWKLYTFFRSVQWPSPLMDDRLRAVINISRTFLDRRCCTSFQKTVEFDAPRNWQMQNLQQCNPAKATARNISCRLQTVRFGTKEKLQRCLPVILWIQRSRAFPERYNAWCVSSSSDRASPRSLQKIIQNKIWWKEGINVFAKS